MVKGQELSKGYADLRLEPFVAQYPDIGYGYVIEVKYLKRGERMEESVVAETLREARAQLAGYLADEGLRRRAPSVQYVGLVVVLHGWMKTFVELPEPAHRQAEILAASRSMTLKQFFTEALEEELRRCAGEDSSREAPWMAGFGALSDLADENRRVLGVIEEEFGTLAPDDAE